MPALWFVAGGMVLWYGGFINLLRSYAPHPEPLLVRLCLLTNLSLLAFVVVFVTVRGNWLSPEALLLVGGVAALTVLSFRDFWREYGVVSE